MYTKQDILLLKTSRTLLAAIAFSKGSGSVLSYAMARPLEAVDLAKGLKHGHFLVLLSSHSWEGAPGDSLRSIGFDSNRPRITFGSYLAVKSTRDKTGLKKSVIQVTHR